MQHHFKYKLMSDKVYILSKCAFQECSFRCCFSPYRESTG